MKLIYEKSRAGRRASSLPRYDLPGATLPEELRRAEPPRLAAVSEPELIRHFTALADRTFGIDSAGAISARLALVRGEHEEVVGSEGHHVR